MNKLSVFFEYAVICKPEERPFDSYGHTSIRIHPDDIKHILESGESISYSVQDEYSTSIYVDADAPRARRWEDD